jgi:hypothetical protein
VIGVDLKLVLGPFNKVSPFLKGSDDCQHLFVMDLIVAFNQGQGLGEECDWVPFAIFGADLGKHCASGKVRGVSFND